MTNFLSYCFSYHSQKIINIFFPIPELTILIGKPIMHLLVILNLNHYLNRRADLETVYIPSTLSTILPWFTITITKSLSWHPSSLSTISSWLTIIKTLFLACYFTVHNVTMAPLYIMKIQLNVSFCFIFPHGRDFIHFCTSLLTLNIIEMQILGQ